MTLKIQIDYDTDAAFAFDLIRQAAWARNLVVIDHSRRLFSIRDKSGKTVDFSRSMPGTTPVFTQQCMADKTVSKTIMDKAGVQVAQGRRFTVNQKNAAWEYGRALGGAFVVKPASGEGGKGVTTNISTEAQFNLAWQKVQDKSPFGLRTGILVERFITGGDHRIVVVGDKVVAALRKWPLYLRGDGVSTISQLIEIKRADRKLNAFTRKKKFEITATQRQTMREKGLTNDLVLPKGKYVELDTIGNLAAGGESENIPVSSIHPGFIEAAIRARKCMDGIDICGLDVLAEDLTKDPAEQTWAVCELNLNADIGLNHFPVKGEAVDAAGAYVEHYFPESAQFLMRPEMDAVLLPVLKPLTSQQFNRVTEACILRMLSGGLIENGEDSEMLLMGPPVALQNMVKMLKERVEMPLLKLGKVKKVNDAKLMSQVTRPFKRQ